MPRNKLIQKRRDTSANWIATNPILASGEEGYETDTRRSKVGDGSTTWSALPYLAQTPVNFVTSAVDYTVTNTNDIIGVTAPSKTVTMHSATTAAVKRYTIQNSSLGVTTLATTAGQTINGSLTYVIPSKGSATLVPNGSNWLVVGSGAVYRNTFDVRDYGALFDGTTDDTSAIQATLDAASAAGGGIVELPRGVGRYNGVITIQPKCTLRGQGIEATVLQSLQTSGALNGGAAIKLNSGGDDYIRIEGFKLIGNGDTSTSGTGILDVSGVNSFLSFKDLYISGFPEHDIYLYDPILSTFERLWLRDAGLDNLFVELGTSCTYTAVYATGGNRSGIHLKSHTYASLNGCAAEYSTFGYWLESSGNITLNGCGGEVAMRADAGVAGVVAHHRLQNSTNIVYNAVYSTKFAYLNGVPAYHLYITGSKRVILNAYRGKAPLGGTDPGEIPTGTVYIDSTSEVTDNSSFFDVETGGGQNGSFANQTFSEGLYNETTGTLQNILEGKSYIANSSSRVNYLIPNFSLVGKEISIVGKGSGGWKINHAPGTQIHFGNLDTNSTTGGSVASTHRRDAVKLVCTVANTEWTVVDTVGTLDTADLTTATSGKTSDGSNSSTSTIVKEVVSPTTVASNGILYKGTARTWLASAGTRDVKFIVYADSAGSPGAKLAESDTVALTATSEAAVDFLFSGSNKITISSGTTYWVGLAWTSGTPAINYSRDTTVNGHKEQEGFTWPLIPNPFGTPSGTFTGTVDAFITYMVV